MNRIKHRKRQFYGTELGKDTREGLIVFNDLNAEKKLTKKLVSKD